MTADISSIDGQIGSNIDLGVLCSIFFFVILKAYLFHGMWYCCMHVAVAGSMSPYPERLPSIDDVPFMSTSGYLWRRLFNKGFIVH